MWYECQRYNSPSKSQFVKVNHYRSKYGLQHGALEVGLHLTASYKEPLNYVYTAHFLPYMYFEIDINQERKGFLL